MTDHTESVFKDAAEWLHWYLYVAYGLKPIPTRDYTIEETRELRSRLFKVIKRTGWTPIHTQCIGLMSDYIHGR